MREGKTDGEGEKERERASVRACVRANERARERERGGGGRGRRKEALCPLCGRACAMPRDFRASSGPSFAPVGLTASGPLSCCTASVVGDTENDRKLCSIPSVLTLLFHSPSSCFRQQENRP